ncbi:calponin homology domain-containing protein DDB_G0272472 isoform X2 [Syngnathoides biaculeatus]|uniref:calponin homology domain-containing protein DDB_G0272472 isoform X2 n=1 Tax=Syngnathoides biaculeatus TaxID=300417 RepID=UPI002ADE02B1|nr:calponin homology domain-containing protein DDB_G0272472 isoform X2 [Syngnathoides biaculeatus]
MAAQVEVHSGEAGRTMTGGRLHLSPLTNSSNTSPSTTQSDIITPEPKKPVPGPKPRLTPKPFPVENKNTIKPILAPKPQTKPRPESTNTTVYKPEIPNNSKPQQPVSIVKPRPVSVSSSRPGSTSFRTSTEVNPEQTAKPVHPFKPPPPFDSVDANISTPPLPAERQKPKIQMRPMQEGASIARAKSLGFLNQSEKEDEQSKSVTVVPPQPKPRGSKPRPVSAIFLNNPEIPVPAPRVFGGNSLSSDLTSKFESIGLSLHRRATKPNIKECTAKDKSLPQKTQKEKISTVRRSTDGEVKQLVSNEQTNNIAEKIIVKEMGDQRGASIKSRINLLLDSSSAPEMVSSSQISDILSTEQTLTESEPQVTVKQLMKYLSEATAPTQSPVMKPAMKHCHLLAEFTKSFSSEKLSDFGNVSLSEATEYHKIRQDPQRRLYPVNSCSQIGVDFQDHLNKTNSMTESTAAEQVSSTTSNHSGPRFEMQTVQGSLFNNTVGKASVTNGADLLSNPPLQVGSKEDEGTLVTAMYKDSVSPKLLRVNHTVDTFQGMGENLSSRHSEGNRKMMETSTLIEGEPASAMPAEQQPRYLRIGSLQKWPTTDVAQEPGIKNAMLKHLQRSKEIDLNKDKDRQKEADHEETPGAPKRMKTLPMDEKPKPKAIYFALTGQIQASVSLDTGSDIIDSPVPSDDFAMGSGQIDTQGKIAEIKRNMSINQTSGDKKQAKYDDIMEMSHVSPRLDDLTPDKKTELVKIVQTKDERQNGKINIDRDKERQMEIEKQALLQYSQMKEREMQREFERRKSFEMEKQKQRALQSHNLQELEFGLLKDMEKQRQLYFKQENANRLEQEMQRGQDVERHRELEKQRQKEMHRQMEQEKEKQQKLQRQREQELERQQELMRLKEQEIERQLQQMRIREQEKGQLQELQSQKELMRLREQETETQREQVRLKEQENERQQELRRLRDQEKEERKQFERHQELTRLWNKEEDQEQEQMRVKEHEMDKARELVRQTEHEKERRREHERYGEQQKQKDQEIERQREVERQKTQMKLRQQEKERKQEQVRLREEELERRGEFERRKENGRLREQEMEKWREHKRQQELLKQTEQEIEREQELQEQLILSGQEMESQRAFSRQQEQLRQKEQEMERMQELEQQEEQARLKEQLNEQQLGVHMQQELKKEQQREWDRQRQREEKQTELDMEMLLEMQKNKQIEELERGKERKEGKLSLQNLKRKENQKYHFYEVEKHWFRENAEKTRQMALEQEILRLKRIDEEWEKQRQMERDRVEQLERERFKELDRLRDLQREKQLHAEKQKQRLLQQALQNERSTWEAEREKMEKAEAEKMRQVARLQEAERHRLKEKHSKEEHERMRPDQSTLRPKVVDVDSLLRAATSQHIDPSLRWKEPYSRAEEPYKPSILDVDSFKSQSQPYSNQYLLSIASIQEGDPNFCTLLRTPPESDITWKIPPRTSVDFTSPVWTLSTRDPQERQPSEVAYKKSLHEPRKHTTKVSPDQLLCGHDTQSHASHRWRCRQGKPPDVDPYVQKETTAAISSNAPVDQVWLPRELKFQDNQEEIWNRRRSQGFQELNRMRSRSMSRRSAPSGVPVEKSIFRIRSRSAHREQDLKGWNQSVSGEDERKDFATPVGETDSQYGTWETGLRTDDSLTPATPSSESNLSPSPRNKLPSHSQGEHDIFDGSNPPSKSENLPLLFPDAPTTLLDTGVLRSRVQLGKKRAPRTRPSRAARQNSTQAETEGDSFDDWLYRDSTEDKVEHKMDAVDSEEQARGADAAATFVSQPQRIPLFPGVDSQALKVQLKKRSDSDNQTDAPPSSLASRSPKSPFLARAPHVLLPAGGKEISEEESPQWLKELKSKKRLSQYENES